MNRVPTRVRTGCEHCRHRPTRSDTTGGDDGQVDHVSHLVEKRQQTDGAAHVTSGLDPLGDNQVAACVSGGASLAGRADLPARQRTAGVRDLDELAVGRTPEELDEWPSSRRFLEGGPVEERDQEVDADRHAGGKDVELCRQRVLADRAGEHPQCPGFGDGNGERRRGHSADACLLHRMPATEHLRETGRDRHRTSLSAPSRRIGKVVAP